MLVDEADTFMKENEGLRGVLNAAHGREGAFVIRTVGEGADLSTKVFRVWVPIAIAGIGKIHPTLEDRSLSIQLHRQNRGEEKEQVPRDSNGTADLKRRCARWAEDHLEELRAAKPEIPDGLRNRSRDNWWSLLAIADAAGGDWPGRARKAAVRLVRRAVSDDEDFKAMLLEDVRFVFERHSRKGYLSSADVVKWLVEEMQLEGRPWKEFSRGKPITTTALARSLKPFGVKPKKLSYDARPMGYELHGPLQRAFDRFLPPLPSAKAPRKGRGLFATQP
jgi:putative DNA primase/helicase